MVLQQVLRTESEQLSGACIRARETSFSALRVPRPARLDNGVHSIRPPGCTADMEERGARRSLYFINGLSLSAGADPYVFQQARRVAEIYGQPAALIANDRGATVAHDLRHCVAGKVSSRLGRSAEPTVDVVMKAIRRDAAAGKRIKFVVFSQGALILRNALDELRAACGEAQWKRDICPYLEVVDAFGSPVHSWPAGVHGVHYQTTTDGVSQLSSLYDSLADRCLRGWQCVRRWVTRSAGDEALSPNDGEEKSRLIRVFYGGANGHYLATYLSHFPELLAERYKNDLSGLEEAAKNGDYSPEVVGRALKLIQQKKPPKWKFWLGSD